MGTPIRIVIMRFLTCETEPPKPQCDKSKTLRDAEIENSRCFFFGTYIRHCDMIVNGDNTMECHARARSSAAVEFAGWCGCGIEAQLRLCGTVRAWGEDFGFDLIENMQVRS
jgi:hypothetical protein